MKKFLMLCVMGLCAELAMGQVPIKVAVEQGVEALSKGAIGATEKSMAEIPLVERSVQNVMEILGKSAFAGQRLVEASVALKHLTPEEQVALNVRGLAGSFDAKVFNYSIDGLSTEQIQKLEEAVIARENELIATRATILNRERSQMLAYASYMQEEIAKAFHPAAGQNTASWLAEQLPQNLEFLCIAEENAFMLEGLSTMDNLLTEIRAKFPEREIVLVTSFVPNKTVFFPGNPIPANDYHYSVWQSAAKNNISVAGVDISVKMNEAGYLHPQNEENLVEVTETSTSETAMGQELQRKHFMAALNKMLAVYNRKGIYDPLFIVYGRPVNMLYNGFASVADDLDKSLVNMKVLHLAPTTGIDASGKNTFLTTDFERRLAPSVAFQMASPANKNIAWQARSSMPKISGADIISKQDRR